jgi:peroxiredoxin
MQRLVFVLIAAVALLSGLFLSARQYPGAALPKQQTPRSNLVGEQAPPFRLGSSTGEFVTPADFQSKTLLINFWATWCVPCREEMPMLVDLQNEFGPAGLQVIGIAVDDVQSARDFAQQYGISYPILVGATDVMQTSTDYGNVAGVLPYSVLVDRDGIIRWQHAGEIERGPFEDLLDEWL